MAVERVDAATQADNILEDPMVQQAMGESLVMMTLFNWQHMQTTNSLSGVDEDLKKLMNPMSS